MRILIFSMSDKNTLGYFLKILLTSSCRHTLHGSWLGQEDPRRRRRLLVGRTRSPGADSGASDVRRLVCKTRRVHSAHYAVRRLRARQEGRLPGRQWRTPALPRHRPELVRGRCGQLGHQLRSAATARSAS